MATEERHGWGGVVAPWRDHKEEVQRFWSKLPEASKRFSLIFLSCVYATEYIYICLCFCMRGQPVSHSRSFNAYNLRFSPSLTWSSLSLFLFYFYSRFFLFIGSSGALGIGLRDKDNSSSSNSHQLSQPSLVDSSSVYVCNLPLDISENELDSLFSIYGKIKKIKVYVGSDGENKVRTYVNVRDPSPPNPPTLPTECYIAQIMYCILPWLICAPSAQWLHCACIRLHKILNTSLVCQSIHLWFVNASSRHLFFRCRYFQGDALIVYTKPESAMLACGKANQLDIGDGFRSFSSLHLCPCI